MCRGWRDELTAAAKTVLKVDRKYQAVALGLHVR